jgi:hypothetical protein
MQGLSRLIVRVSESAPLFALTTVLAFGSLFALMRIGAAFPPAAAGAAVFDLQNTLTAAQVLEQLPGYTDQARRLYFRFTAVDFLFPFAASLFLAAIVAFCLRHGFPGLYAMALKRRLLPLVMAAALFDWIENVAVLVAITAWPGTTPAMASAIVVAKRLKLGFLFGTQVLVGLLVLATAVRAVLVRSRRAT